MKFLIVTLCLFAMPCLAEMDNAKLVGSHASLIIPSTGKKWDGTISKVEPDGITIVTSNGGGKVFYIQMTASDLDKYGCDPKKLAKFLMQQQAAKEDAEAARIAKANQPSWHEVQQFSGTTGKSTAPFTITSNRWRVKWSQAASDEAKSLMKASGQNADAYAVINAEAISDDHPKADTQDIIISKLGAGSDSTELRGKGNWLIKVNSANSSWTLTVEEFR